MAKNRRRNGEERWGLVRSGCGADADCQRDRRSVLMFPSARDAPAVAFARGVTGWGRVRYPCGCRGGRMPFPQAAPWLFPCRNVRNLLCRTLLRVFLLILSFFRCETGAFFAFGGTARALFRGAAGGDRKNIFVRNALTDSAYRAMLKIFLKNYFGGTEKGCIFASAFAGKTGCRGAAPKEARGH